MRVWNSDGMKQINHTMKKLSVGIFWWSFYTVPVRSHSVYLKTSQICVPTWSAWSESIYFKVFTRCRIQISWRHGVHNSIYDCFQLPIHVCTYSLMYFNFFEIFEIGKKGDLVNTIVNSNANAKNQLIVLHIFTFYVHTPTYNYWWVIPLYLYSQTRDFHNLNVYYTAYSWYCSWPMPLPCIFYYCFVNQLLPFAAAIVTRCYQVHTYCWLHLCYARDMPTENTSI